MFVKCKVGKESMSDEDISNNVEAILNNLTGALRRGENNIQSIYLKLTMGPAIRVM
jgi:large subunit ribosomal protein L1